MLKIEDFALRKRLNNAEYLHFMSDTSDLVRSTGPEKLGISAEKSELMDKKVVYLKDIVAQSRTADQSAEMVVKDRERDDVVVYILGVFRVAKNSPIKATCEAGRSLYNATKPYIGCQELPHNQETELIRGLLVDLKKEDAVAHLATLALTPAVEQLNELNEEYAALSQERANWQQATKLDAAKVVRDEMEVLYDDMMSRAFAQNIVVPTEETAAFIASQNKLIADAKASFNLRMGVTASKKTDVKAP